MMESKGEDSPRSERSGDDATNDVLGQLVAAFKESMPSQSALKAQNDKLIGAFKGAVAGLEETSYLDVVEEKVQLPRKQLVQVIIGSMLGMTILSFFIHSLGVLLTRWIGFVYPVYASMIALNTKDKTDDTQWLMYWVIFAMFSLFEQIFLGLCFSWFLPLYFSLKIVVLLWCQGAGGARFIYMMTVLPLYKVCSKLSSKYA